MILCKEKITRSFKINFGLLLSIVIKFYDFIVLIKLGFEFQISFKN